MTQELANTWKEYRKVKLMSYFLKDEYRKFLEDIEKNIKNEEDLSYIKKRFSEFMEKFIEKMDTNVTLKEEKIEMLEQNQKLLEKKMEKMQEILDNIEKDIYAEDGFDFEIVCPYCNYEFVVDMDENQKEVKCPECNNIIELDWSGNPEDDECTGHCSGCSGCDSDNEDNFENDSEDDDM